MPSHAECFLVALWLLTVTICTTVFAFLFYLMLQQQQKLQELTGTIHRLDVHHHRQLNHTFEQFAAVKHVIKQLAAPGALASRYIEDLGKAGDSENGLQLDTHGKVLAHNQVFTSNKVHEDTYTIELVPPFRNAWLIVDASLGTSGIVCSGKADAILRAEHKIFSFYAPPVVEKELEGIVPAAARTALAASDEPPGEVAASLAAAVMKTTTTTTPKACMIMTTALKEHQSGSVIVLINFKRDPESLNGANSSHIHNVSGKIQWFPQ